MRRKDREVTDFQKINAIIDSCTCCRLGMVDDGQVYIVPLNFGYTDNEGKRTLYFHGAKEGRKIELIKVNDRAGFEMDVNVEITEAEAACDYSCNYQSVIGSGKIDIIDDVNEKEYALKQIMLHNTGKSEWDFPEMMMKAISVFKLEVEEITCKEHL